LKAKDWGLRGAALERNGRYNTEIKMKEMVTKIRPFVRLEDNADFDRWRHNCFSRKHI